MSIEGHAAAMHKPLNPEHIARQREVDARWTRTLQVGGSQGRGNPPATRYHSEASPSCEDVQSWLASPWLWAGGAASVAAWSVLAWWLLR